MRVEQRERYLRAAPGSNQIQTGERGECVQACLRTRRLLQQVLQKRYALRITLPNQHHLRHVALPAAGAVEGGDEARGVELVEPGNGSRLHADGDDAVDAALVVAGPQVEGLLP